MGGRYIVHSINIISRWIRRADHGSAKVSIASRTKKHDPTYYLTVTTTNSASLPSDILEIHTPFMTWFTADGYFVAQPFQKWLATSIEMIGNADLKNAARDERDELASPGMPDAEVNGTPRATGNDSRSKGSKRSKRKG